MTQSLRFPPCPNAKPAAQGCGRVLGATIELGKNTTTHWTSQARFDSAVRLSYPQAVHKGASGKRRAVDVGRTAVIPAGTPGPVSNLAPLSCSQ